MSVREQRSLKASTRRFRRPRSSVSVSVLDQAIRTVEQVESNSKIVFDYATFCEQTTIRPDCFYDANVLPYPKEAILSAIERQIVRSPPDALVDWLSSGALFMWNFLEGVGPDPLPFKGLDISQGDTPRRPRSVEAYLGQSGIPARCRAVFAIHGHCGDGEKGSRGTNC